MKQHNIKIIGIFGSSGSGKSTTANILGELLNDSYIFHMDNLMHHYIEKYKSEFLEEENGNKNLEDITSFIAQHNLFKKCLDTIKTDIENDTYDLIQKKKKDGKTSYIILDWAALPSTSLYQICDVTIHVICDKDVQLKRLRARLEKDKKLSYWKEEELEQRINHFNDTFNQNKATYCIDNSLDNQILYDKISQIIEEKKFS